MLKIVLTNIATFLITLYIAVVQNIPDLVTRDGTLIGVIITQLGLIIILIRQFFKWHKEKLQADRENTNRIIDVTKEYADKMEKINKDNIEDHYKTRETINRFTDVAETVLEVVKERKNV